MDEDEDDDDDDDDGVRVGMIKWIESRVNRPYLLLFFVMIILMILILKFAVITKLQLIHFLPSHSHSHSLIIILILIFIVIAFVRVGLKGISFFLSNTQLTINNE